MAEIIIPEKFIPGGQTIGRQEDGKKVLIWGALPGEKITDYKINKNKSHYLDITALSISSPSEHRVKPKDEIYLSTSPWQIIDYDFELKTKQSLVVEVFKEHGMNITTPEIITDNRDYYYRNKMEYSLFWDHDSNNIKLAFHERGSHRKVPINSSSIERPEIFNYAKRIVEELNARGEEARKYQSLLLRCNQAGKVSGGLYENYQPHPHFDNLEDTILGQTYSYSPNGFFQINLPVYEMALQEIKKYIKTDKVLDLYAGVGTIGLSVTHNQELTLIEIDRSAFLELKRNCYVFKNNILRGRFGGYDRESEEREPRDDRPLGRGRPLVDGRERLRSDKNIIFNAPQAIFSRAEEALSYIEPVQTVILDPPRAGCDKKLIDRLNEVKPRCIIYLSCNPATQARDIKLLSENYKIETIKTFNFFPHTPHIENLVVLFLS